MRKMLVKYEGSKRHQEFKTTIGSYVSFIQDKLHQAKEDKTIEIEKVKLSEITWPLSRLIL